ncbi:MAG: hypothetical protein VW124_21255 [Paracoccaceae bacterium]
MLAVIVHMPTWFVELFRLVKLIDHASFKNQICFIFPVEYPQIDRDVQQIEGLGIRTIRLYEFKVLDDQKRTKLTKKFKSQFKKNLLLKFLDKTHLFQNALLELVELALVYFRYIYFFRSSNLQIKSILVGGDMPGYDTVILVKMARKKNIPITIFSSTMTDGKEQLEIYSRAKAHTAPSFENIVASICFPNWVRFKKFLPVMRVPGFRVLALEWFSVAPSEPWKHCSGRANTILVESDAIKKYHNFSPKKTNPEVVVIGSLAVHDALNLMKKNSTIVNERFQHQKPILVSALPPDFYYMQGGRPEAEFSDYATLVSNWFGALEKLTQTYNIICCLHPSVELENYIIYENENLMIWRFETAAAISLADVYFCSVSSTIRTAIGLGIPVVNYDTYRYRYVDFKNVSSVAHCEYLSEAILLIDSPDLLPPSVKERKHWGYTKPQISTILMKLKLS